MGEEKRGWTSPLVIGVGFAAIVEATAIGTFNDSGRLVIRYDGTVHADMDLAFMHDGIPEWERQATYTPKPVVSGALTSPAETDLRQAPCSPCCQRLQHRQQGVDHPPV